MPKRALKGVVRISKIGYFRPAAGFFLGLRPAFLAPIFVVYFRPAAGFSLGPTGPGPIISLREMAPAGLRPFYFAAQKVRPAAGFHFRMLHFLLRG